MEIIVSPHEIDLQECDIIVSGFFSDERPLKGSAGLIDWRLNGRISRLLADKKIIGEWKETLLIPSNGRIIPKLILLFGFGSKKHYSYLRAREITPYILNTLSKIGFSNIFLSLPYHEDYNVDCGKLVEVILEEIGDFLIKNRSLLRSDWVENLKFFFGNGEQKALEILMGIQTAKLILKNHLDIKILTPSKSSYLNKFKIY